MASRNGNTLYFGDNLDILREYIEDESADLIYLDPPFNSQAHYNVLFKTPSEEAATAQAQAFRDMWTWEDEAEWAFKEIMKIGGGVARFVDALRSAIGDSDMMAYLVMMAVRLHELRRTLKPTGSLYLHCDPAASHYLKVIMDGIFGSENFRNEVIWKRTGAHGRAKRWGPVHDTLLFYTRSDEYTWNRTTEAVDKTYLEERYNIKDANGSYQPISLTGPGTRTGSSGQPWRNIDPKVTGRHWELPPDRALPAFFKFPDGYARMDCQERLDVLDAAGLIYWPPRGTQPRFKRYAEVVGGNSIQDVITDIAAVNSQAVERIGYPTQKPMPLLQRIINASSNPGDVILDPFCGCGTTIEAAQLSGRQWVGIDIAIHAIKVIEARLQERVGKLKYKVEGIPKDYASAAKLAERDKYQFQWWANYLFNPHALREQKKGADRGVDGELLFPNGPGRPWGRMLTSVKGGEQVGPAMVRDFAHVLTREQAQMGLFICLHRPTKAMALEARQAGWADTVHGEIPKLQIVALEDWFEGKLPKLPPLEHLPSAAFSTAKRRAAMKDRKAPDATQPELPLTFAGGKGRAASTVHFNLSMVRATG